MIINNDTFILAQATFMHAFAYITKGYYNYLITLYNILDGTI